MDRLEARKEGVKACLNGMGCKPSLNEPFLVKVYDYTFDKKIHKSLIEQYKIGWIIATCATNDIELVNQKILTEDFVNMKRSTQEFYHLKKLIDEDSVIRSN